MPLDIRPQVKTAQFETIVRGHTGAITSTREEIEKKYSGCRWRDEPASDYNWRMDLSKFIRVLKDTAMKWWDDNALRLSAALSYYTLFSLAPLLTIALAIAGVVIAEDAVKDELRDQFQGLIGKPGAEAVANMLDSASQPVHGGIATIVSLVTLVVVSMGMFGELQDALNLIWRIPGKRSTMVWRALKSRLLSFILVIGTGFLLLVSLIMNAILAGVGKFVHRAIPIPEVMTALVDAVGSPMVITVLFALMFKMLPEGYIAWKDVWIGAIATATLFMAGKWAIGLYLGGAAMASMYGAASSLMAVLVWVYYSALIFFLGAEFTYVYAHEYGSRMAHLEEIPAVPS
jgi:membrane protein